MPNPSYYFTLFKKFQVVDHVPEKTFHGKSQDPSGKFSLNDPNSAFTSIPNKGALLGATPAASPLWAILNAKANNQSTVSVGGNIWKAMPKDVTPAWTKFQLSAPDPKLVDVFANWITAAKVGSPEEGLKDVPDKIIGAMPTPFVGDDVNEPLLFVCSYDKDQGLRPGRVPEDFWSSSFIFLVDPTNGDYASTKKGLEGEYYLTAVVGNRGKAGGQYLKPPALKLEAQAWVMVWNTGMSPAVQLPALSNLDVNSKDGVYEVYFLHKGQYELVGFRLLVQTVFDGLVAAIIDSGMDLGGLTPDEWVHAKGAHLCAKVLVRKENEPWPPLVGDTPLTNPRLAQKNLAPFAVDLAVQSPDPNINWTNFVVGDVIRFIRLEGRFDDRWGMHRLTIKTKFETKLPPGVIRLYLAVPKRSFARWLSTNAIKGFKLVDERSLDGFKAPFPENVILMLIEEENWIEIPPLREAFLAMSLGIEYSVKRIESGTQGSISVVQQTAVPKVDMEKKRYEIEQVTVGGFTLNLDVYDSRTP